MPPLEFAKYRDSLGDRGKEKLDELFHEEESVQRDVIDQNIKRDREHLRLINFCADPFRYNGSLHKETGYLFIRVEPLYGSGLKNFDATIFNQSGKAAILVECKSSISDADKEVSEVARALGAASTHKAELERIIGDTINMMEYVICTNAAYASRVKNAVIARNLGICIWSADQASSILLLEKHDSEVQSEILAGRLHHDTKLTRLLLDGVRSEGTVRSVMFLPSSHPCTILEEIIPFLNMNLEKSQSERFHLSDLSKLLGNHTAPLLYNFSDQELWRLAEHVLEVAAEVEIFRDRSPAESDVSKKEFELGVKKGSVRTMTRDVRKKYADFHATRKAESKSVDKFQRDFSKVRKLTEF